MVKLIVVKPKANTDSLMLFGMVGFDTIVPIDVIDDCSRQRSLTEIELLSTWGRLK
jgi:hypothetical protein